MMARTAAGQAEILRAWHWAPALAFVLLASGLAFGCAEQQPEVASEIRPVRYARAFLAGNERARTFAGVAQAASEQDLAFRVAGTVIAVEVDVGSQIRRGQVLAQLDSGDLELKRQQAEAGVAQAYAQARNARAAYERVVALYEGGIASMSDLDAARAAYESANASEKSAATALRLAEQQVAYARLAAPGDGSVAQVAVDVNEAVGAGQPVIVVIDTQGSPEVRVMVPEAFIGGLKAGRSAQVVFGAVPDRVFDATVAEVGTAAAGAAGFPALVRLNASPDAAAVRPGMAAEVTFAVEGRPDASGVLVPPEAVGQDQKGRFVFVLALAASDNAPEAGNIATAERRNVRTGALTPEGLEVVDGVSDGEYVATAGLAMLAPGQRVRLLAAP
ncbi:MAG: efflux RND transporter periplasmic adaptor subunit [Gammaproteobacteria bacterium]|nr:efflux RND transporter periplasmic adaptor subunit [Gammaproteobacteria bacterium]